MPYQADIIRGRKVSVTDMQEGEYVINEFAGKVQGLLKLNGRLHATDFIAESNAADLKSSNELVINDGISDRVIIGDIGITKDGTVFGIKVSSPGHDARFAPKTNLLLDSSTSIDFSYKFICHNFQDEIDTSEVFLPWFGITESSAMTSVSTSFLVPYSMTLRKLMMRPTTITGGANDLTLRLKKMDNGDTTVDTVATALWDVSDSAFDDLASGTLISFEKSHFDNNPKFEIGDKAALSIQAAGDHGGSIVWTVTSIWEVEVVL